MKKFQRTQNKMEEIMNKKFDFKKLLILALALVLVFALVACNNDGAPDDSDDGGPQQTPLSAGDYFTALWNASKSIGSTAIPDNADIGVELGLEVDLAVKQGNTTKVEYKLGVEVAAIYDRDNSGSDENVGRYSSVKVKITDRTKTSNSNLVSLYYFLDEPTKVYAEMYNHKVVLQFNADNGEGAAANQQIISEFTKFMNKDFVEQGNDVKSIDDIILDFTGTFGPDFDLDDVLGVLLNLLGMDMQDLLASIRGIVQFQVEDENNPKLLDLLNGLGKAVITNVKKDAKGDGGYTWSCSLTSTGLTVLSGFTDGLIGEAAAIAILFDTNAAGTELGNLAITLKRPNITGNTGLEARIAITKIEAKAVTAAASGTGSLYGIDKSDFKEDFRIDIDAIVSVQDAMLKLSYNDNDATPDDELTFAEIAALYSDTVPTIDPLDEQAIQGELKIEAEGHINLLKDDSKTAAYAKVYYRANSSAEWGDPIVEASFENDEGVATAKIWMDKNNEYAVIARDYLILNIVKALHKSNEVDAQDPANPTRQELLDGTNGAVIAALLDAFKNDSDKYFIYGLELQTMLWDLFFVPEEKVIDDSVLDFFTTKQYIEAALADGWTDNENGTYSKTLGGETTTKTKAELYEEKGINPASYPMKLDILKLAQQVVSIVDQDNADAFKLLGTQTIANILLKEVKDTGANPTTTHLGIFETMPKKTSQGIDYNSFKDQTEFYAFIYKGDRNVIKRFTDAGVIGAIKLEESTSGKYAYNDKYELVEYKDGHIYPPAASGLNGMRYNLTKSTQTSDAALIGNGTWFYQNASTINKEEALKMWRIATGDFTDILDLDGNPVDQTLYEDCIENTILTLLAGSSFLGAEDAQNEDAWLDNILQGKLSANISYVSEEGFTIKVEYTDLSGKKAKVELSLGIEALSAPYAIPEIDNLDFDDETAGVCVIDLSSYMEQIRDDAD
jgi:hypothetical protein